MADGRLSLNNFEKKNDSETKDQKSNIFPLLRSYQFEKTASRTKFDPHIDVVNRIISPMLHIKDVSRLMQASQHVHQLFRKPFGEACLTQLLQHVIHGEQKQAEAMIQKHPLLLLHKDTVTDYSGRRIKGTPYQLALGAEDIEMAQMIQNYLMLEGGESEIIKQQEEQFPPDEKDENNEDDSKEFNALRAITQAIRDSTNEEITAYDIFNLNISEKCQAALAQFRLSLEPKGVITKGLHFNAALLQKAFELYYSHFNAFGGSGLSPKNMLFWRQVIGYIQRFLPACYAQACSQGFFYIVEKGEKLKRSFKFRFDAHASFFPLDANPQARLGYEEAVGRGLHAMAVDQPPDPACMVFKKFMLSKTGGLTELMQYPGSKSKNITMHYLTRIFKFPR